MNIPSLPTDNLYKFMALSGLVILVISVVYPKSVIYEIRVEQVKLAGELEISTYLRDSLPADPELPPQTNDAEEQTRLDKLAQKLEGKSRTLTDLGRKNIELGTAIELNKVRNKQLGELVWLAGAGVTVGGLMSLSGFALWYFRVQRYQDMIIKKQAELEGDEKEG